mmetsp:Transcript_6605/g.11085  ORF Transcript_6605/g.11085 Transcript_6605/m.11085 type:complete len:189 (-) Transcript_6605:3741-4307(-)
MSMICCFGICIPYSVIWPFLLILLKQIWDFISPLIGKKASDDKKVDREGDVTEKKHSKVNVSTSNTGVILDWKNDMGWDHITNPPSEKTTTILRFTASWCKPCKSIDPFYAELCKNSSGEDIIFYNVDVDENEEIAALNGAISIPLFVAYRNGELLGKLGGKDEEKIRTFIEEVKLKGVEPTATNAAG